MIPFNIPAQTGCESEFLQQVLKNGKMSGDGPFGHRCQVWFEENLPAKKYYLPRHAQLH